MKKLFDRALEGALFVLAALVFFAEGLVWSAWEGVKSVCRWAGRTLASAFSFIARVALVSAFFLGGGLTFLYAPNMLPVPNAWAETARGALQAISAVTGAADTILSSNGALFTFGQLFPGEDVNLNRIAIMQKDSCTRYTADQVPIKTGPGKVSRIIAETLAVATDDFILYDNTAASGTVIFQLTNMPATSTVGPIEVELNAAFTTGLTLDVTIAAGSSVTVCLL